MTSLLKSLNGDGSRGLALLAALALLLLAGAVAGQARPVLQWQREAIAAGEWWRLIAAHFVHLDLRHAAVNAAGLALVWILYARAYGALAWVLILLAAMAVIDAGLWWLSPRVQWYVGASGVLHGALAAGLVAQWRRERTVSLLVAALLAAKLAWEQWRGPLPLSGHGPVLVASHLYGTAGGLAAAWLLRLRWTRRR